MLHTRPVVAALLTGLFVASSSPTSAVQSRPASSIRSQDIEGIGRIEDLQRPVHVDQLRALRSFFERVDVAGVAAQLARPAMGTELSIAAAVARLPAEWEAPLFFVQGAIGYVPYAGSVRGARGTLESGGGNAVDQALLLAALLRARGVETRLARGRLDWAAAARLVVGTSTPSAPEPGDPWPRWLEGAADHWWVQARRDGQWIDLDPSFVAAAAGEPVVVASEWHDRLPPELLTRVRIELRRGDLTVAEAELPASRVVGETLLLGFTSQSRDAVELWELSESLVAEKAEALKRFARGLGLLPRSARTPEPAAVGSRQPVTPPAERPTSAGRAQHARRPSAFRRIFLDPDVGPWTARLQVPGQVLETGPFEESDLDSLSIRVTVLAPGAPAHSLEVPWGGGAAGALAVAIGAGRVPDARLAVGAEMLHAELNRLAALEQAARGSMLPPISYYEAVETLDAAARDGWRAFERRVPGALAWALLQATDRVSDQSPGGRVVREGLRLAAVRWRPPGEAVSGSLEVVMSDPVTIGQLSGLASAASLRAANGLLQSAVLSQILNRLVERAPETAFDVTLRAIGTGSGLIVVSNEEQLPAAWPAATRAEAMLGLRAGYAVMAPGTFDDGHPGWWHVGVFDGEMVGWIPGPQTALHGRVDIGSAAPLDDLETLLASLPWLHRATRWLADLSGSGPMALASVPAAACGSATVAANVLARTLAPPFPHPDVLSLCGPR